MSGYSKESVEPVGIMEPAGRRGRLRFQPEVLPEVIAWLLLLWQRQSDAQRAATDRDPQMVDPYTVGIVGDTQRRMDVLQWAIDAAPDAFGEQDYAEALVRVGMMIAARSDSGEPLTKIGRLYARTGGTTDGPQSR